MKEIFAVRPDRAVAAFNVFSYEDACMVVKAAEETKCPVFLMANKPAIAYLGYEMFYAITSVLAKNASVPVAVHLDHSSSYEGVKSAIEAGFSTVMFDGSSLPVEENIEITKRIVKLAHDKGVSVEAEIGHVSYSDTVDPLSTVYTTPEEAKMFAEATGIDALAVSIGTVHRMTTQDAVLRFDLLKDIKAATDTPIVIHGSTGVSDEDLVKLSKGGVRKINIGTALRHTFGCTLREEVNARPEVFDRLELFKAPMQAVYEKAKEKILILNK
ncbi:MAG: class II fructose-bisphosphate aldolase [Christensenellaceae bacterium]|nr:class II fructose-bisphosphate aldolase [Christensenellaceae bacterium]